MESIKIMMEEHKYILRMLKVVRKLCLRILNHEHVDYTDFYKVIDFVRNYADKHHHSKEEEVLFRELKKFTNEDDRLGPITGMFVEHDLGRLYMSNLENALKELEGGNTSARLDIIANSISYADLLHRHIEKEDTALYAFAERTLPPESIKTVEEESSQIEARATQLEIQNKYIALLEALENKLK